jgi:hypothetical protein
MLSLPIEELSVEHRNEIEKILKHRETLKDAMGQKQN